MKKVIIISAIAILLTYAGIVIYRQKQLIDDTDFKLIDINGEINLHTGHVIVTLAITNKSSIDVTLMSAKCNVYLNQLFISTIDLPNKTLVKANSIENIDLVIDFDPKTVLFNGLVSLIAPDKAKLIIKGTAAVNTNYIVFNSIAINSEIPVTDIFR